MFEVSCDGTQRLRHPLSDVNRSAFNPCISESSTHLLTLISASPALLHEQGAFGSGGPSLQGWLSQRHCFCRDVLTGPSQHLDLDFESCRVRNGACKSLQTVSTARPQRCGDCGCSYSVSAGWVSAGPQDPTDACACRSKRTGARLFLLYERPLMSQYASVKNIYATHSSRCKPAFFHCRCGIGWGGTASTPIRTIRLVDLPHAAIAFQVCKEESCR